MKGLLLSYQAGMWDSVLSKVKTNTRRSHKSLHVINEKPDNYEFIGMTKTKDGTIYARFKPHSGGSIVECRARYSLNEISFLQEPTMNLAPFVTKEDTIMYQYRDHQGKTELSEFKQLIEAAQAKGAHWGNKMFMAQSSARYFIKIKRIEIERLNDISDADCLAEGIQKNGSGQYYYKINNEIHTFTTPKKAYFSLYNAINKNSPQNPWVFSYHFELCKSI